MDSKKNTFCFDENAGSCATTKILQRKHFVNAIDPRIFFSIFI